MKKIAKNQRGITLISLSITIIIMMIVTGMLIYNAKDSTQIKNLTNMYNDIENLRDKISSYYLQYGAIPASIEYTNSLSKLRNAGVIGANDIGSFYVIDLRAIDGLTLNYGQDYEIVEEGNHTNADGSINFDGLEDLYIINETSHNIFYIKGITVRGSGTNPDKIYYTDAKDIDTVQVELK